MKYKVHKTETVCGRPPKATESPKSESVYHNELGHLCWTLKDGTIVICRSYKEYKPEGWEKLNKEEE